MEHAKKAIKFAPFGRRTSFNSAVYGGRYALRASFKR